MIIPFTLPYPEIRNNNKPLHNNNTREAKGFSFVSLVHCHIYAKSHHKVREFLERVCA